MADFLEGELPKFQAEWEAGSFSALEEAFLWCAGNGYTFPEWLIAAVQDELAYSKVNRPRGGTKTGNSATFERYESNHRVRYHLVEQHLKFQQIDLEHGRRNSPISAIEAARDAETYLRSKLHPARTSAAAILKSYKRLRSG